MSPGAPFGLLLDVDGPLASTVTRTLRLPSIAADLVAIANAGCPVVFNTGRSDVFLAQQVIPGLVGAGLAPDAPVWGISEKGAAWFAVEGGDISPLRIDRSLAVPDDLMTACRVVCDKHRDLMFWDDTKRIMASLEQNVDVPKADYLARQPEVIAQLDAAIAESGRTEHFHSAASSIALDVEHRRAGKALGAERALLLVSERTGVPRRWYTAGDSVSDYDMATWLHDSGYEVSHLDVRPGDAGPEVACPVFREVPRFTEGLAEDDITAAYLARWRALVTS